MIKINLILCYLFFINISFATETSADLFKKVFGQDQTSKRFSVDVSLKDYLLGSASIWASGNSLEKVSGADLNLLLKDKIRESKKATYTFATNDITLENLPFKIRYSEAQLKIELLIPDEDLAPLNSAIFEDLKPYYAKDAIPNAELSFGTNYKIEKVFGMHLATPNFIEGQTDSFLNVKNIVLENQMHYLSNKNSPWYRQASKLSFDYQRKMQRFEVGDISYPVIGYQQGQSLGGVSFYRDFSLNPYLRSVPTSTYEYEIFSRSLVKTFINGALIKTEYMNTGHYSVKDVPLNNGLNHILIEVTDEFDKKKVYLFNEAGSLDLLTPELSRYSFASGYPAINNENSKNYDQSNGPLISGFYQRGINNSWTVGGYIQGNKNYSLIGANNILATNIGNFLVDYANSKNNYRNGQVIATTFQHNMSGVYWYTSHTFTTKVEYRSPWFNETGTNLENHFNISTNASYSVPLFEKLNLSISGLYQNPTTAPNAKLTYETSLTANIFNSNSLSFFVGRSRDENKLWSTQIYCFLNISFSNQETFASAFYENQTQTKRLSLINDSGKKVHDLKSSASIEDGKTLRNGTLDLQYNSNLADIGLREEATDNKNGKLIAKTSIRLLSSISFVYDKDNYGFSIGRPIANSFVIFKPAKDFIGQRFGTENDSDSGIFGESMLSGLTPYQYRRLQLNPTHLSPGHYLSQESYILYPRFRSGHLFIVGKDNLFVLKGTLIDQNKTPISLKVGYFTTADNKVLPFFTNRDGDFFIEGATSQQGILQLDEELYLPFSLTTVSEKKGIVDLGKLIITTKENL